MIARTLTLGAFALTLSVIGATASHAEGWFPERGVWNPMEARHAEYRREELRREEMRREEMRHDGLRHEEFRRDAFRHEEGRRLGEHQGPARMQFANTQHIAAPVAHVSAPVAHTSTSTKGTKR
jgi:hypothetical protein